MPFPKTEPLVPSRQLGDAIERRQQRALLSGDDHRALYSLLGTSSRKVYCWRSGEITSVRLSRADELLLKLDLNWWDVWNEDTVRVPLLAVVSYSWRRKHGGRVRHRYGRRYYGDAGPDLEALERIRRAFEGEPVDLEQAA